MTNKAKIIWVSVGAVVVSAVIWLWWRQKDAVPLAAVPLMQQARATLSTADGATGTSTAAASQPQPDPTQALLGSIIPGYIPLPSSN